MTRSDWSPVDPQTLYRLGVENALWKKRNSQVLQTRENRDAAAIGDKVRGNWAVSPTSDRTATLLSFCFTYEVQWLFSPYVALSYVSHRNRGHLDNNYLSVFEMSFSHFVPYVYKPTYGWYSLWMKVETTPALILWKYFSGLAENRTVHLSPGGGKPLTQRCHCIARGQAWYPRW